MSQSHDPYLYNDQLQTPGKTPVHWNDLPYTITADVFEQLDFFDKLIRQRVCRTWKSSLEESPSTLLIDDIERFHKIKSLSDAEDDEIVQSVKSTQVPFRDALRNTRELVIINIKPAQNSRSDGVVAAFLRYCRAISSKEAIGESLNLRHVIVGNARSSDFVYQQWLVELGILILERPVTFSLVHCNLIQCNNQSVLCGTEEPYELFPTFLGECQLKQVSLTTPLRERHFSHRMALTVRELIFPYPNDQLAWLKTCRERLVNLGELGTFDQNITEEQYVTALNSCVDGYYDKDTPEPPDYLCYHVKYGFASGHDFERFAVLMSFLARQIANRRYTLPPPPHPIPLCPTHINSTICTCLADISNFYKPYSTCANMKIHEQPREAHPQ